MSTLPLFPADVFVRRVALHVAGMEPLFASEEEAILRAAVRRRREFAAGRACARQALAALGVAPCGIPVGDRGMPIWPVGIVGSITHDGDVACAAVAPNEEYESIGVDTALTGSVSPELGPLIGRAEEVDQAADIAATLDPLSLLFSAKESVYKCFYPIGRMFLDFKDVVIAWNRSGDQDRGTFRAVFIEAGARWNRPRPIVGQWVIRRGRIYTSAYYRRQSRGGATPIAAQLVNRPT